jgi:peptidoglycan/LPS O-acetylase OafA/YrhL
MQMGPPSRREIELDFIRGIAILLVLSFHYQSHNRLFRGHFFERLQCSGWVGVDIFFVLSGFLVGGLIMKEWKAKGRVATLRFLQRRAFRIWPGYYVFLATAAAFHVRPLKEFFWQNLINIQNYVPTSLSHTWSLAVEEQFYLSLAAVITLFIFRGWRPITLFAWCVATIILVEVLRAVLILQRRPFFAYTHTRLDALVMGVLLAILYHFYPRQFEILRHQRLLLGLIVSLAVILLYFEADPTRGPYLMTSPFLITFVDYASAALLLLLYRPGGKHRMLYRVISRIGVCSYGIYLWHVSVERPVDLIIRHVPGYMVAVASTFLPYIFSISVGFIATAAVDGPALRLRQRFIPAESQRPEVQPASIEPQLPSLYERPISARFGKCGSRGPRP